VLIDNFKLVERGTLRDDALRGLAREGGRIRRANPRAETLPTLAAPQIAANEKGALELKGHGSRNMAGDHRAGLHAACAGQRRGNRFRRGHHGRSRMAISRCRSITGQWIQVRVRVDAAQRSACIDFSGTSPPVEVIISMRRGQSPPPPFLYVFRTLGG